MEQGHFGQPEVGSREIALERLPRQYDFSDLDSQTVLEAGDKVLFAHSGELDKFEAALISALQPEARQDTD